MKLTLSKYLFNKALISFFVFGSVFLTIRVLIIGTKSSENLFQYFISLLPELFGLLLLILFYLTSKSSTKEITFVDKFFVLNIVLNLILSLFFSSEYKMLLYGFRMTYIPMVFYVFGSFYLLEKKDLVNVIDVVFKWFSVIAILGCIIYFGFYEFMTYMLFKVSDVLPEYFIVRMTSLFWTPVVFGAFMSASFLYFVFKYFTTQNKINLIYITLFFFSLLMSLSRGAILVAFIGFVLLLLFSKKWKLLLVLAPLLMITFLSVSFIVKTPTAFTKWILTSTIDTISMQEGNTRGDLNKDSFNDVFNNPFGRGIGKAGHVAERFSKEEKSLSENNTNKLSTSSTDGWFLKLANETGLLGLALYLIFTTLIVVKFVKDSLKKEFGIEHFLFTILIIVNIQNLVSNVLDFYLFSNLYWFLIGSLVYTLKFKKENGFT